ncbi:hypothetical protein TNCV_1153831 [Trichonephila clavipes]|nr:hypothetical protein TNCV_1153831 [Trichonephila clavipes]
MFEIDEDDALQQDQRIRLPLYFYDYSLHHVLQEVLKIAPLKEWNIIRQSLIDNLIPSKGNRCAAVLIVRGDHILH